MAASDISFEDIQTAATRQDPAFVQLLLSFLNQYDPPPPDDAPDERIDLQSLKYEVTTSWSLRRIEPGEQRMVYRQQKWADYLAQAWAPAPRLKLDQVMLSLHEEGGEWGRQTLLQLIAHAPLKWGPWRAFKQLFKRAESSHDLELLGAIGTRCDAESVASNHYNNDVTGLTLGYLRRRAWRYLRRLAQSLPTLYPSAAVQFLRWYPDYTSWSSDNYWNKMWIGNHIFFHQHKAKSGKPQYGRTGFKYKGYYNKAPSSLSKFKAFPKLWESTPEPLMDLLLLCRSGRVAQFSIDVLRDVFQSTIRELPLEQLIRLGQRPFGSIQLFVKSLIEENPAWQKASFQEFGLHDLVIDHFLFSQDEAVRDYAIKYAQDYASDLPLHQLLALLGSEHSNLNEFAGQLLAKRNPREELGLEGLQKILLLGTANDLAKKLLKKGFRPSEIPTDWFKPLLFSNDWSVVDFAVDYLQDEYPKEQLDVAWFQSLLGDARIDAGYYGYMVRNYAQENLKKLAAKLEPAWIKEALLDGNLSYSVRSWIEEGKIKPGQLDLEWIKLLVQPSAWQKSKWVADLKAKPERWIKDLSFRPELQSFAIELMQNTELVSPVSLGLEWLVELLQGTDSSNQSFADELLSNHFNPIDFAAADALAALPPLAADAAPGEDNPFEGKSFLFTGKLSSLTRSDAQKKVAAIDGVIAKSVTKTLDFLVIGDDGSPLFGGGAKGSKMVKAESLQADGAALRIISETDWLRMISEGSAAKADVDPRAISLGFDRLLQLATDPAYNDQTRSFALRFLQARHPILGPQKTGKPLEGNQVIPRALYDGKRFLPLLEDARNDVQQLAIQVGRYELRRWKVPPTDIFGLCESPHRLVRRFAIQSLLGAPKDQETDSAEDCYFPPEELDPDLVFSLTENHRREVRQAGIDLILKYYQQLGGDQRILRLAESPSRDVRSQAVRALWLRFRRNRIPAEWSPKQDRRNDIPPGASADTIEAPDLLLDFIKIVMFGIPPGRLPKGPQEVAKPWSNNKAKLHIIELMRDLALEDQPTFDRIEPLFQQFLASHHKTEALGCLVALTQLRRRWHRTT